MYCAGIDVFLPDAIKIALAITIDIVTTTTIETYSARANKMIEGMSIVYTFSVG